MPVPATTGQLRTNISDMQVGDYIVCNYQALGGAVGTFSNFGGTAGTEIPVTGSATPNGAFYFIKADKGLLIADRVVQTNISWDRLNAGKLIQGLPWDAKNIIPTMTSNTTPSGAVSASWGSYPWWLFDSSDNYWGPPVSSLPAWASYEFPQPTVIRGYSITSRFTSNNPKDWTFEASNDGLDWVEIDKQSGITDSIWGAAGTEIRFLTTNSSPYKMYRIRITASTGGSTASIRELKMFETVDYIRSLTGGVAYADANGNPSTTDQGFGGWPTNNEWDKYIVNFPTDKIQAGKTLDDVFHWSNAYTFVQDTSLIMGASYRTVRGLSSTNKFYWFNSGNIAPSMGFRPVFVYQE